ncbi:MAG: D-glycero-beta-D-manno-heptose-7-phosphate kinase [Candidatus Hydrogenedentota bacterium]|jgi:D-beta-D-heptose 7-phosphate kinase/D-beta-D-heptose 1-phosphate adenosyltransferase|uniref:Bifunctional protein HldE n=1 Tax=Sumerlaea chitinivorans TaxID=2250252 RepID=A0A2Z4Y506_SUMC1|nr:ADP-heptose synthase [Candidatus Sumerlaea chitinivorans]MCX7964462.1 D-glycero-beta-D-manno-heptose-7-phosphate kinase [Candidatus Sumerlaea chitinivorans]RMH26263.1 MAG: D-glycero-beta-D-manno-heptose-7-phosphate kinase [Candidatus Hydrogenedentota bacterium]GIX44971.1 MAG: bifunctional protein HldE [Candidatus Sumerlaea sp.]
MKSDCIREEGEILQRLARTRLLVVGDLICDHYIRGVTERTSPEAPVPIVVVREEHFVPGGAANVARNICHFGAQVKLVGVVGQDDWGRRILESLGQLGADCSAVLCVPDRPTTIKTRILSHNQQMLRVDREETSPLSPQTEQELIDRAEELLSGCDAVILSDYAKGVLTSTVVTRLIEAARRQQIPLFVDPKGRDYRRYRNAFGLTPNAREAAEASGAETSTLQGLLEAAHTIRQTTNCDLLVITRGADGLALFYKSEAPELIPSVAREVFDVTGAGDTFVAFLAMGIGARLAPSEAARIANAAAGIVVGKSGAATVSQEELSMAISGDTSLRKTCHVAALRELGESLRRAGKRIVFTNGCFDFIHAGHVAMLQQAKALGDVLVVATNSDETIHRLKGAPRPIIKQRQREKLLAAIEAVDYVVVFEEPTPHKLLELLRPDFLVKGRNYSHDEVEGWEIVESYGGKVVLLDVIEDISTRKLVERVENRDK